MEFLDGESHDGLNAHSLGRHMYLMKFPIPNGLAIC